jgi:hypothetical protein
MLPDACFQATGTYPVEVSGWDRDQVFFVEKSELEWDENSGKQIVLKRALRDHAIIFVRLLQPNGSDRSFPVAYEPVALGTVEDGQYNYRLNAVRPRPRNDEI